MADHTTDVAISLNNYNPGTVNDVICFNLSNIGDSVNVVFTTHKNHQFPTLTSTIFSGLTNVYLNEESYVLKVNKFVTLSDEIEMNFDILGHWLHQDSLRRMFNNTPNYMKDIHEDEEEPDKGTLPC